jgi:heterodisulfide reductase subunit B
MLPRPDYGARYSDTEYPDELDNLLAALGAQVVDFPLKTHCCGGHMTQIGPDTAFELIRRLVASAAQYKADVIVTVCPMCQMNLDAFQGQMNNHFHTNYKIPILFFTQLMGVAFGEKPEKLGFGSEFVSAREAMNRLALKHLKPLPKLLRRPSHANLRDSPCRPRVKAGQPGSKKRRRASETG